MSEQLTGRALDKAIAEALGWKLQRVEGGTWGHGYIVLTPDGKNWVGNSRHLSQVVHNTEALAWGTLPAWSADANATLAVCAERGLSAEFYRDGATIRKWDDEYLRIEREWYERGEPQEAAARALLAALTATEG